MFCPRCDSDSDMSVVKDPYLIKHRCSKCESIYVKKDQFKKIIKEVSDSDLNLLPESKDDDSHPTIHCPKCMGTEMSKKSISVITKIIIDYCPECEGVFLDKEEFSDLYLLAEDYMPSRPEIGYLNGHKTEEVISKVTVPDTGNHYGGGCYDCHYNHFSIYFKENLGLGLNMFAEKWTYKLAKIIGLSGKQDIQIGDRKIDSRFIIQGYHDDDIILLLSDSKVRQSLYDLKKKAVNQYVVKGNFKITDSKVTYCEGPYNSEIRFQKIVNPEGVQAGLLSVVEAVENYYTSGTSTTSKRKF